MRTMKTQKLYDLREAAAFCSGEELHDFFMEQLGDPSPKGDVEVDERKAGVFIYEKTCISWDGYTASFLAATVTGGYDGDSLMKLLCYAAGLHTK